MVSIGYFLSGGTVLDVGGTRVGVAGAKGFGGAGVSHV